MVRRQVRGQRRTASSQPKTRARAHPCLVGGYRTVGSSLRALDSPCHNRIITSTHSYPCALARCKCP